MSRICHLTLLFIIGFSWGYMLKTIVGKYQYIGWNDPQVITRFPIYDVDASERRAIRAAMNRVNEVISAEDHINPNEN